MPADNPKSSNTLDVPGESIQIHNTNGDPSDSESTKSRSRTGSLNILKPQQQSGPPAVPMNLIFFMSVLSLISYISDVTTDLLLVYSYYSQNAVREGSLTLLFVLLPSVGVLMDKFYRDSFLQTCTCSKERMREVLIGVKDAIFIFFTTVKIYSLIVCHAWVGYWNQRDRKGYRAALEKLQNEACRIRFYESTFEALPQLVLQAILTMDDIHNKTINSDSSEYIRIVSIIISLVSISWGISSYISRTPVTINPLVNYQMSFLEKLLNFLGSVFELGAHVLAISLSFYSTTKYTIIVVLAIRCLVMVTYQKCTKENQVLKNFSQFALVMFGICVPSDNGEFAFTYKSYLLIFICDFVENTIYISLWYNESGLGKVYKYTFFIGHYVALVLGFVFMILFYWQRKVNITRRWKSIGGLFSVLKDEDKTNDENKMADEDKMEDEGKMEDEDKIKHDDKTEGKEKTEDEDNSKMKTIRKMKTKRLSPPQCTSTPVDHSSSTQQMSSQSI